MSPDVQNALLGAILDAEGPVLGSNAGALIDQTGLTPDDFADRRVSVAWSIAQRLAQRRRPVDARQVHAAGVATKLLADSDLGWLQGLQAGNGLDRERFADLSETMRNLARGAKLITALEQATAALREREANLPAIAGQLEATLRDAVSLTSDDGTGDQDVAELANDWDRQETEGAAPVLIPTGITAIDDVIGGLVPNLNMIVGLPSVGKSAALGTMIDAQLEAGFKVGLFGLEDGTKWLAKRLIARDMAMPVRSVGTVKRTPEQGSRFADVGAATATKLSKLVTYRHDTISIDELCRRAASWVLQRGVQIIYVDHGGEVDHHSEKFEDHRLRVAESYRRLRNVALRYQVPVVVLAHTARPGDDNEERPPRPSEIAESAYIERRARLILGLWRRHNEADLMRATVLKQTEGPANITVKLQRHTTAALLDRYAGERVDLFAEKMAEARALKEKREADKLASKEAAKAQKGKKGPPQLSLAPQEDES